MRFASDFRLMTLNDNFSIQYVQKISCFVLSLHENIENHEEYNKISSKYWKKWMQIDEINCRCVILSKTCCKCLDWFPISLAFTVMLVLKTDQFFSEGFIYLWHTVRAWADVSPAQEVIVLPDHLVTVKQTLEKKRTH